MKALATPHWRLELLPASPYCVRYVVADNEIGFAYDCQTGEHSIGTDRRSSFKVRANSLAVRAKGWDVYSRSRRGGEYLRLVCKDLEIRRGCHDFIDERAAGIAHRLRSMLLTHADPLDCEALVLALRDRVDDLSETRNEPIPGWITPQRLRRIDDLIDLRLSENLLVTDLSAALGLSTRYFAPRLPQGDGAIAARLHHRMPAAPGSGTDRDDRSFAGGHCPGVRLFLARPHDVAVREAGRRHAKRPQVGVTGMHPDRAFARPFMFVF